MTSLKPQSPSLKYDVAIVGAGPAGLFAAASIAATSSLRVILIDKGPAIYDRNGSDPVNRQWVEGIGGAGLFSDGKLCLSLDVGGYLRDTLPPSEKRRLVESLSTIFKRALNDYNIDGPNFLVTSKTRSGSFETSIEQYPVLHVGTDRGTELIHRIVNGVANLGVDVRSNYEMKELKGDDSAWDIFVERKQGEEIQIHAKTLILAMGKVGAQLETKFCSQFGARIAPVPMYLGIRLECETTIMRHLFVDTLDPKIKLSFPDGTKVKTHCASLDGEIASLHYEGLALAGGHSYSNKPSGRSGFAILWDGVRGENNYLTAIELMRKVDDIAKGKLLAQLLSDYRDNIASTEVDVGNSNISVKEWSAGNIRSMLPLACTEHLDKFFQLLSEQIPGLYDSKTILVAPAIEWWMSRVSANPTTMLSDAGIYVCGDGSGWSQGIVHAAATGIIAGEHITGVKLSGGKLSDKLLSETNQNYSGQSNRINSAEQSQ